MSWKDVRKTAKDSEDKDADIGVGDDAITGGDVPGAGPVVGEAPKKNKKSKINLPWDMQNFFSEQVPERDDEEDEEDEEMNYAAIERLRAADERTSKMDKDEYVHFSECRQASFTFRKAKRFREWAGFGTVTESKPNDDIIDILGFLTFEMVQTLMEEAIKVKAEDDMFKNRVGNGDASSKKRKLQTTLFEPPEEDKKPVGPSHVREAYRRLQSKSSKPKVWMGPKRALQRTKINLVRLPEVPVDEATDIFRFEPCDLVGTGLHQGTQAYWSTSDFLGAHDLDGVCALDES